MDTAGATVDSAPSGAIETPEGLIYTDEFPVYEESDEQISSRMSKQGFDIPTDDEQVEDVEKMLKGPNKKVPHETNRSLQKSKSEPQEALQPTDEPEEGKPEVKPEPDADFKKKMAEMQTAYNKKFYNLSKEREGFLKERDELYQNVQPLLEIAQAAKSDPHKAMKMLGVDTNKMMNEWAQEQMKLANMTPEQQQEYYHYKQIGEENQRIKQENEHSRRYFEQVEQEKQRQVRQTRIGELGQQIANLHKESGLTDDPIIASVFLDQLQEAARVQKELGVPVSSGKIVQSVKNSIEKVTSKTLLAVESLSQIKDPALRNHIVNLVTQYATAQKAPPAGQPEITNKAQKKFVKASNEPQSPKPNRFLTESQLARMQREGKFK